MLEVPFIGGNLNDATRVGDTVRRRAGPWTPAVHALLLFLENAGFEAPRVRGVDGKGREILEYIDGDVHPGWPDPAPSWVMDDDHLAAGARLLRHYHDLVAGFVPPADSRWRFVAPTAHEIVCHNDWAPWNALFRERRLAVMLDWDMAGPGTRLWDIANSAYSWVPLLSESGAFSIDERAVRLRRFCDAYGLSNRASLLIASRSEPPGWMIAVTPARAATSMPSGNGKYASEAMTASRAFSPALRTAVSTATTRDIWPGPTPTVASPLARTIAFEVTCFTQRHAKSRSVSSSSDGVRSVATLKLPSSTADSSGVCTSMPPAMRL